MICSGYTHHMECEDTQALYLSNTILQNVKFTWAC